MNPRDLLSAALDQSGNSDLAKQNISIQPSTSSFDHSQRVQDQDIKPFVLNGQCYYQTPKGVVQFKANNTISIVSQFELNQALAADKARKQIQLNGLLGLNNLAELMNNGQPFNQFNFQVQQLQNPAYNIGQNDVRQTNRFLINNHIQNYGQMPMLIAQQNLMNQGQLNQSRQDDEDFLQMFNNSRRSVKLDFTAIYNEAQEDQNIEEEEADCFKAETYAEYMPAKLKIGLKHPDTVVETSSLSSVVPPDNWYKLMIPEDVYDMRRLSALQLESIVYACQQHETFLPNNQRAGFLIGDGAGVGKGRTIAGIIYENYLQGRKKAIWFSVGSDLKYDAERDLNDIGAKISVHALNKLKYSKISSSENGKIKKGVIFSTYSSLISESTTVKGKCKTRLGQLLQWCGEDFDGVIIFDECHKAKNLVPQDKGRKKNVSTKTGLKVKELQDSLPNARIVYASATGATEPRNMAYMTRLGLWGEDTAFLDFPEFNMTVEKRGVGAMELVAIDMKQRGMYIDRQLSFKGVEFRIDNVELAPQFIKMYDDCVDIWVEARSKFEQALNLMEDDKMRRKTIWSQFWSAHQRFFKYLCISAKVDRVVQIAREEIKNGNCVVIGLQSTGEAKTLEALQEQGELNDFVSTAKAVFESLIAKHFPAPNHKKSLALLGIKEDDLKDYSDRKSRRARHETEKRMRRETKLMKDFIVDDDETEDEETEEDTPSGSNSDDENFALSDEEDDFTKKNKNKKKKKRTNKVIDDDDEDATQTEDNSNQSAITNASNNTSTLIDSDEDYSSVNSAESSSESSSDEEELWEKYTSGGLKRAKGAKQANKKKKRIDFGSREAGAFCEELRDSLLKKFNAFADNLPSNTIDDLINKLGGPSAVAEMTGRKGRVVENELGEIMYESRKDDASLEMLNITEKERFMNGEKLIAIISEAASSGISLQSDRRVKNKRRRIHITIELAWSADRVIQQFGRTHRSNQTNAPKYVFMISNLAGEQRFASTVAKRLESLGALTHGDRRATESRDLSKFNLEDKYATKAIGTLMNVIQGLETIPVPVPAAYKNEENKFFYDVRQAMVGVNLLDFDKNMSSYSIPNDKETVQIERFLNRLLGMKVNLQNALFDYFADTMDTYIKHAKKLGKYDQGIYDLTEDFGKMVILNNREFTLVSGSASNINGSNISKVNLHKISVERGIDWQRAVELNANASEEEGFYQSRQENTVNKGVFLAIQDRSLGNTYSKVFHIYKPNTGLQPRKEPVSEIKLKGRKIKPAVAQTLWENVYSVVNKGLKVTKAWHPSETLYKSVYLSKINILGTGAKKSFFIHFSVTFPYNA